jgi:N-acetylmuramoyl-L-alanine amidase
MRGVLGCVLMLLMGAAHAQELREIRLWDSPDGTRVVLDLDTAAQYEMQTLSDPDRVVIDLQGVKRADEIGTSMDGRGLVQRVRSGEHDGALRVVLDLASPTAAKVFALDPNSEYRYRLVIDLAAPQVAAAALATVSEAMVASPAPEPVTVLAPATPPPQPAAAASVEQRADVALPEPQRPAPVVPTATKPSPATRPTIIAIDAGHGGEDPGARGKYGTEEKDIALAIARHLARMTEREPGFKAVLIRDGDYFIPLRGRINKARAAQADLFVSIHCNASPNREATGSAVYALSPRGATNEHARWLAGKENASDLIGGIELQDKDDTLAAVLFDISQTSAMEASIDVGSRVLGSLADVNNLVKPDVQQAGFVVLKSPDIPSILVETAFISNPQEERQLSNPEYQARMAESILAGIKGYFATYRPANQIVADTSTATKPSPNLVDVGYNKSASKKPRRK